jgi:hypothetical protein
MLEDLPESLEALSEQERAAALFACLIFGETIEPGPPRPGSFLARLRELSAAIDRGELDEPRMFEILLEEFPHVAE